MVGGNMAVVAYKYAMILDENIENTALFEDYEAANNITKIVYGEEAFAVEIEQWPVASGYKYKNGTFYEPDGNTVVEPLPNPAKQVAELETVVDNMTLVMADMIGGAT